MKDQKEKNQTCKLVAVPVEGVNNETISTLVH